MARKIRKKKASGPITVELSILDRAILHNRVIVGTGSLSEAVTSHNLRAKLRPTEEEREEYTIKGDFDKTWEVEDDERLEAVGSDRKPIEFTAKEVELVSNCYILLVQKKAFPRDESFIDLWLRLEPAFAIEVPKEEEAK